MKRIIVFSVLNTRIDTKGKKKCTALSLFDELKDDMSVDDAYIIANKFCEDMAKKFNGQFEICGSEIKIFD